MGEDIKIGKIEFGRSLNDSELKEIEYHAIEWGIPHQLKMVEEIRELKDKLSQAEGEITRLRDALYAISIIPATHGTLKMTPPVERMTEIAVNALDKEPSDGQG